jgi:A/G-specific adenine glycosylase
MSFANRLLDWYEQHGRHNLPWQVDGDPYSVWISEIMLQQTQVVTVIPYYERFINQFPRLQDLAEANTDMVLHLWSGLGYYARARDLHKTAKIIADKYNGIFPDDIDELVKLPGIGRSTAGAILAQSHGQRHPILDGNVKRVLTRYYCIAGWPGHRETEKRLWQLSEKNTPSKNTAKYTQAIMDLGATVCKRSSPHCTVCPLQNDCKASVLNVVDIYPHKRKTKKLPVKKAIFLLLRNEHGEIYLIQRPPVGIWGGLWCLPELVTNDANRPWHIQQLPADICAGKAMPSVRHTFSHYHLDFTVIPAKLKGDHNSVIMESKSTLWYNPADPSQLGLAAPIKKIIHSTEV